MRWGAGRKKSGGTRAWELIAPPHPQLTSEDTVQPVLLWRGPREGCSSPRMGTEGLHCARGKGKMFKCGIVLSKGKSSWYEAGEDGRGPWNQGVRA